MSGRPQGLSPEVEARPLVLSVVGVTYFLDYSRELHNFNLSLRQGELVGLLSPDGVTKTTIFNLLMGVLPPSDEGHIYYHGAEMRGMSPHEIVQMGIARTFQDGRIFSNLTVLDNVLLAEHPYAGYGVFDALLRTPRFREKEAQLVAQARELLAIFDLELRQNELAASLPHALQRRLEMARVLATRPRILILDEPALGMNPQEMADLSELLHFVRERFELTILLVEQRMRLAMDVCEWLAVMDFGEVIACGLPQDVRANPQVIAVYLGRELSLFD